MDLFCGFVWVVPKKRQVNLAAFCRIVRFLAEKGNAAKAAWSLH